MARVPAADAAANNISSSKPESKPDELELSSWKQDDEFHSSDSDSRPKTSTLPVDCTEQIPRCVIVEQSISKACFPPLPLTRNATFQNKLSVQMNEILVRLDKLDSMILQGFEKGDITITKGFQQFVKGNQLSGDELKELIKQMIWPELMRHREEFCDMMCTRIQKIIQNELHHLSVGAQSHISMHHEKRTSDQSSKQATQYEPASEKPQPIFPDPMPIHPAGWSPTCDDSDKQDIIIVANYEDYEKIQQFLEEKKIICKTYWSKCTTEGMQAHRFSTPQAASPSKCSNKDKDNEEIDPKSKLYSESASDDTKEIPTLESTTPKTAESLAASNNSHPIDKEHPNNYGKGSNGSRNGLENPSDHKVNEGMQAHRFSSPQAASPSKCSNKDKDNEEIDPKSKLYSESASDDTKEIPTLESTTPKTAESLAASNNSLPIDKEHPNNYGKGSYGSRNGLENLGDHKVNEGSKGVTTFPLDKLMGNRTLIEPTQLFELFKEKEEYRQQCLALEQRLKDKEEFIQQLKATLHHMEAALLMLLVMCSYKMQKL
ncbi:uncharacterized protein [Dysidea avara]|uniref:uncharacterized protein isoform X2 n=1 Tax=Dysidea avara TaxID=196820 RepID=UPI003329F914